MSTSIERPEARPIRRVAIRDLRVGDVVHQEGLRVRVTAPARKTAIVPTSGPVYVVESVVLSPDPDPFTWPRVGSVWHLQGNDHARFTLVERAR